MNRARRRLFPLSDFDRQAQRDLELAKASRRGFVLEAEEVPPARRDWEPLEFGCSMKRKLPGQ